MFEIFNNIGEMTFVFKDENLIYANNAACFYTKSYEKSLLKKEIRDIFEDESVDKLNKMCEESREFKAGLVFKKGKGVKFKIKLLTEYDQEFMLVQSVKPVKPVSEQEFNRIIAPRMIYDPIKAGKFHIMNYEISDGYMRVQEELKELSKLPSARKKAEEISDVLNEILEEIKIFADELIDVDQKYVMVNTVFSVNELLWKITTRMNSVFKLENIDAEVFCDTNKSPEMPVLGDYMKIGSAIVTLITLLVNILVKRNKKAKIVLRITKEDKFCCIDIVSKDVTINKKTYDEIISPKTEIINLNRYKENKLTLNIHIASAYIELNEGELSIKRDKKEGTIMTVKLPVVQKKYFFGEQVDILSSEYIDNIISKIVLRIINNV